MSYFNVFITGGLICVLAQILIDKTNLTPARILVLFVVCGCVLGGLGVYEKIVEFGGCGATVPLPGFGYLLFKGVKSEIDTKGFQGVLTGGLKASSGGITAAILFSFLSSLVFNPKVK